jgi:hypothetical protein
MLDVQSNMLLAWNLQINFVRRNTPVHKNVFLVISRVFKFVNPSSEHNLLQKSIFLCK